MLAMHCIAHQSNLTTQCLSNVELIARLEKLLLSLHKYFARFPKQHQELVELGDQRRKGSQVCEDTMDFDVVSSAEGTYTI